MSLLQIQDPRSKPKAVGIDLGTTNSLVAYVSAFGETEVVRDCDNEALVPSVVHFGEGGSVEVGTAAKLLALSDPKNTIVSVKRFIGLGPNDPETTKLGPYDFDRTGNMVRFVVRGRSITPIEVSARILRELYDRAQDEIGQVGPAVITVPAYFDDSQRQATKDAAKLAGIEVLRLLNEPTAAALAYGLQSKQNGKFVVFDLGGGTFDVTALELEDGVFQVRSTGGDTALGGDDFDRALAEWLLLQVNEETKSAATVRYALDAARMIKHALTDQEQVIFDFDFAGAKKDISISREHFEALIQPFIDRTKITCIRALRDAEFEMGDLDGVILVGGATRVPSVRRFVQEIFGREPLSDIDPDLVVAQGAAIQADLLTSDAPRDDVLLLDVLPLSLGVESMGGVVERILPRNTAIPCRAMQIFTTYAPEQTGFDLHVVQGERELAADCRSLARFTLSGIPKMAPGIPRLELTFAVDENGILQVSAIERVTGLEQNVEVKPTHGLRDEDIEIMLVEAFEHGEDDVQKRLVAERKVEASRVILAAEKAMAEDKDLLQAGEGDSIANAIQQLKQAIDDQDAAKILGGMSSLDAATLPFAERRMDRAMRGALRGQNIAEVERATEAAMGVDAIVSHHQHR